MATGSSTVIYEFDNISVVYGDDGTITFSYTATSHGWGSNTSCSFGRVIAKDAAGNALHTWQLVLIFDCFQQGSGYTYTIKYDPSKVLPTLSVPQLLMDPVNVGQCNQM